MSTSEADLFQFGVIVGTHGLKGDLKVRPQLRESTLLCEADRVVLRADDGGDLTAVPIRAVVHKGNILLRLQGKENINLVSSLVGRKVLLWRSALLQSSGEAARWTDLKGVEVFDRRLGYIGKFEESFTTAAHDIYVVQGPFGEVMMPVVDRFICEVDIAGKRMMVDLPEGLVPESDEN